MKLIYLSCFFSKYHPEHKNSLIKNDNVRLDYVFFHEFAHAATFFDDGNYLKTSNQRVNEFFKATNHKNFYKNQLHQYMERQLNEVYADCFSIAHLCKKYDFQTMKEIVYQIKEDREYVNKPFEMNKYGFEEHETAVSLRYLEKNFDNETYNQLKEGNIDSIQTFIGNIIEKTFPEILSNNLSASYLEKYKSDSNKSDYAVIAAEIIKMEIDIPKDLKKELHSCLRHNIDAENQKILDSLQKKRMHKATVSV